MRTAIGTFDWNLVGFVCLLRCVWVGMVILVVILLAKAKEISKLNDEIKE
jgi:hypothetical protein